MDDFLRLPEQEQDIWIAWERQRGIEISKKIELLIDSSRNAKGVLQAEPIMAKAMIAWLELM